MTSGYIQLRHGPAKRPRQGYYYTCEVCDEQFYHPLSRVKEFEKRGTRPQYCSMKCRTIGYHGEGNPMWGKKHTAASIEKMTMHPSRSRFPKGEENPNYYRKQLIPKIASHPSTWRRYLILKRGNKCERCGYNQYPVMQLHHIDRNRRNNTEENLILLCPNCHEEMHYIEGTGRYKSSTSQKSN